MKISLGSRVFLLNALIMTLLLVGFLLTTATGIVESDLFKQATRLLAIALAFSSIAAGKVVKKSTSMVLFFCVAILFLNLNPIALNIIVLFLIVLSMSRMNDREAALALYLSSAAVVLLHFVFLQAGLVSASTYEVGDRVRSTLGFSNANQLSAFYMSFTFIACYVFLAFRNWKSFFIFVASFMISFQFIQVSGSRTGLATIIILMVTIAVWIPLRRFQVFRKLLTSFASATPIAATVASFFLATDSNPQLNFLLSMRPYLFNLFLQDLSLFEIFFGWAYNNEVTVDNSFLLLFSALGVVLFSLFVLSATWLMFCINFSFLPMIFSLLFAGIFESFLVRPEIPASVLLFRIFLSPTLVQRGRILKRNRGLT